MKDPNALAEQMIEDIQHWKEICEGTYKPNLLYSLQPKPDLRVMPRSGNELKTLPPPKFRVLQCRDCYCIFGKFCPDCGSTNWKATWHPVGVE